jgi:hypothetical protein
MFKETNWRLGTWSVVAMLSRLLSTRRNKEAIVIYGEVYSQTQTVILTPVFAEAASI